MGNLRQKYTEEEWEELGEKIKKENNDWMNASLGSYKSGNEFCLFNSPIFDIIELTIIYPNDQELGAKIRELVKLGKIN